MRMCGGQHEQPQVHRSFTKVAEREQPARGGRESAADRENVRRVGREERRHPAAADDNQHDNSLLKNMIFPLPYLPQPTVLSAAPIGSR